MGILSNDEINSLEITDKKILENTYISKYSSNGLAGLELKNDMKLFNITEVEAYKNKYVSNRNSYLNSFYTLLKKRKKGIYYSFEIKNEFEQNINDVYITTVIEFSFPNTTKTYFQNHKVNQKLWKVNEMLKIENESILEYAIDYNYDIFKNHNPENIKLKIYFHAKNNVGFNIEKNNKYFKEYEAIIKNDIEIDLKPAVEKDITDLWKGEKEDVKDLIQDNSEHLIYLTPGKLIKIPFESKFGGNPYYYDNDNKFILRYNLNVKDRIGYSPKNLWNNYDSSHYYSLEEAATGYISTLKNVSNINIAERVDFGKSVRFERIGDTSFTGSFTTDGELYITGGKSFYDKNTNEVNVLFLIYKHSRKNKAEMIKILNSVQYK